MRVGILSLIHESNTFAVTPTTIDLFQRDELMIGDEVRRGYEGGHLQISAFLEGLPAAGIEGVPIFHASTPPSGTITKDIRKRAPDSKCNLRRHRLNVSASAYSIRPK